MWVDKTDARIDLGPTKQVGTPPVSKTEKKKFVSLVSRVLLRLQMSATSRSCTPNSNPSCNKQMDTVVSKIRTTNLTHLEAEVPGWADQTGDKEQPLYHPLGLQESPVYQNHKPYSP